MTDPGMPHDEAEAMAMCMRVWAHEMRRKWTNSQIAKDCDRAAEVLMRMRSEVALANQEKQEQTVLAQAWASRAAELNQELKTLKSAPE